MKSRINSRIDPEALFHLHARIGFAVWQIQNLENGLVTFLTLIDLPTNTSKNEADLLLEKNKKNKTLGKLLNEMNKINFIPNELKDCGKEILNQRNWLIHHSRPENHTDIYHHERLMKLFDRLDKISGDASIFLKQINKHFEEYVISKKNIPKSQLKEYESQIITSWLDE